MFPNQKASEFDGQRIRSIQSKRKRASLIIDDLDEQDEQLTKQPLPRSNCDQIDDFSYDDFNTSVVNPKTKPTKERPKDLLDSLFLSDSDSNETDEIRSSKVIHETDQEHKLILSPELTQTNRFSRRNLSVAAVKFKYDIDEILSDTDDPRPHQEDNPQFPLSLSSPSLTLVTNNDDFVGLSSFSMDHIKSEIDIEVDSYDLIPATNRSIDDIENLNLESRANAFSRVSDDQVTNHRPEWLKDLNDGPIDDTRKRRVKYIKNGYAERLQKLLDRQVSSNNFIRHHFEKTNEKIENVLQMIPLSRQVITFIQSMHLINVWNITDDQTTPSMAYILVSNDSPDYLETIDNAIQNRAVLNIYPPWRRMFLQMFQKDIYFCTNFIKPSTVLYSDIESLPKLIKHHFTSGSLQHENEESNLNLFEIRKFTAAFQSRKNNGVISCRRSSQSQLFSSTNPRLNYMMYTQTADRRFDLNSQLMKLNSILDVLESAGYCGNVTFIATVQRIGFIQNDELTQLKTQTQLTLYQNQFKKQLIVSDKCGMFGIVIFPFYFTTLDMKESHKYHFSSLRIVEKKSLFQKGESMSSLDKQISCLWNQSKAKSKCPTIIYVFEFMRNISCLDFVGISPSYLSLPITSTDYQYFDISNVMALKLGEFDLNSNKKFRLFYKEEASGIVKSLVFENKVQFTDLSILEDLKENYMFYVTIRNVCQRKNDTNTQTDLFSSVCLSNEEISQRSTFNAFIGLESLFSPLDQQTLFIQLTGELSEIVEEKCWFDLFCPNCKYKDNEANGISFDRFWTCEQCEHNFNEPLIDAEMQVILICKEGSLVQGVKVNLHFKTIEKILPLEQLTHKNGDNTEVFNVSIIIGKQIGPIYCYVSTSENGEMLFQELYLK